MRASAGSSLLAGLVFAFAKIAAAEDLPVVQMENTSTGAAPTAVSATSGASAAGASGSAAGPNQGGSAGPPAAGPGDWRWDFHGYFRAPLMIGLGKRDNPVMDQSATSIHRPVVPDDQYLSWQYTGHQAHDWAEVFLSYGNAKVKGTVGLLGFSFTDAAFQSKAAQFGIAQAYLTLKSNLGYENVRLEANVGSFWAKYGMAGQYDAGKYDTFLFGRTHVLGETVRLELDVGKTTLWIEDGFGGKQPDPNIYNNARFTLLHHIHGGLRLSDALDVSAHHMYSWAQEEDRAGSVLTQIPNGSLWVAGADLRLHGDMYGELYAGFSHISADRAVTVASAIEVLHSNGGGEFSLGVTSNYLDGPTKASAGTGSVNSFVAQYDFSVANLLLNLEKPGSHFWGDGRDLKLSLFTMINAVSSDDPDMDGVKKIKYGADALFNALSWGGLGLRIDRVQPNSKVPEQSFAVISPRLVFRSQFITHEEVFVQFSRYLYNQRECDDPTAPTLCAQPPAAPVLPDGFGATTTNQDPGTRGAATTRPDLNVFKVQASMWW